MRICFQIITKSGAVIDTEPEEHESVKEANSVALSWMKAKGEHLTLDTYNGQGAVIKVDEVEHIAVVPEAVMAEHYAMAYNEKEE